MAEFGRRWRITLKSAWCALTKSFMNNDCAD
eukprot:CAMPEP_0178433954 /NCGR_PEP_ID=MMETSP0689_2-20121128/33174_1 /TAXON_ID=160604 /ORGANISM="Amphidinium massartii, Strain CS-259" /LENGTH=30 /DNA_ID= /DNA_START= /DNA_END= /DNA_ORIENTATION=